MDEEAKSCVPMHLRTFHRDHRQQQEAWNPEQLLKLRRFEAMALGKNRPQAGQQRVRRWSLLALTASQSAYVESMA